MVQVAVITVAVLVPRTLPDEAAAAIVRDVSNRVDTFAAGLAKDLTHAAGVPIELKVK